MSWFKRKKLPAPELVEPAIPLMGKSGKSSSSEAPVHTFDDVIDVTDMKEVSSTQVEPEIERELVQPTQDEVIVEPVLNVTVQEEAARPEESVSQADAVSIEKAPGKLSGLAARFKRNKAAKSAVTEGDTSDASETQLEPIPEIADAAQVDKAAKGKGKKEKSAKAKKEKHKFSAAPIRVVIGFLPEVTERDALEYAVGIAEKHFEQVGMSYFDAFKYGNGFAFEAHEGGTGKAYLPEIIRYFESQGAFRPGESVGAVIRTATRSVEVQRTRDGLVAVILPERDDTPTSDWLEPTSSMQPAINKRTGFLVVGAALFTTGFIAMIITSMLTRYQEYDPAPEPIRHRIEASLLPIQQWSKVEGIQPGSFVKAIRFRNGRWEAPEIVALTAPAPVATPAPAEASVPAPGAPIGNDTQPAPMVPPTPAVPAPAN